MTARFENPSKVRVELEYADGAKTVLTGFEVEAGWKSDYAPYAQLAHEPGLNTTATLREPLLLRFIGTTKLEHVPVPYAFEVGQLVRVGGGRGIVWKVRSREVGTEGERRYTLESRDQTRFKVVVEGEEQLRDAELADWPWMAGDFAYHLLAKDIVKLMRRNTDAMVSNRDDAWIVKDADGVERRAVEEYLTRVPREELTITKTETWTREPF